MDIMEVLGQLFAELSDEELEVVHREAAHEIEQRTTTTVFGVSKAARYDEYGDIAEFGTPIRVFKTREAAQDFMWEHGYDRRGGYGIVTLILAV